MNIFPSLQGQGWSVTKQPHFATRFQKSVSGRELRRLDMPYPTWTWTLTYNYLRDRWDQRGGPTVGFGVGVNADELRFLMGFFLQQRGAWDTFLFDDPTDDSITGQLLPSALSSAATFNIAAGGSGYTNGDLVRPTGGTGTSPLFQAVVSGGVIGSLNLVNPGAYQVIPGTSGLAMTGGTGSGATLNISYLTTVQLVRTMTALLPGGGLTEPIIAPNIVFNIYFNGIAQTGWTVNNDTGIVTLPNSFSTTQPAITADFTYYFRVRFVNDAEDFENFAYQLWSKQKLQLTSVQ